SEDVFSPHASEPGRDSPGEACRLFLRHLWFVCKLERQLSREERFRLDVILRFEFRRRPTETWLPWSPLHRLCASLRRIHLRARSQCSFFSRTSSRPTNSWQGISPSAPRSCPLIQLSSLRVYIPRADRKSTRL